MKLIAVNSDDLLGAANALVAVGAATRTVVAGIPLIAWAGCPQDTMLLVGADPDESRYQRALRTLQEGR